MLCPVRCLIIRFVDYDQLIREDGAGFLSFFSVGCRLSVVVSLLFLFALLVGYNL